MNPAHASVAAVILAASLLPNAGAGEVPEHLEAVVRALSVRHDPPPCEALGVPVSTFVYVAEHDLGPPWVGLRAAQCALPTAEAHDAVLRWVTDARWAGLARLVAISLPSLPAADAVPVARAALAGPHASLLRPTLARSQVGAVRALVETP